MLVFHFSHDFHASPFVHLIGQFIIVAVCISVFSVSEGVFVKLSRNRLAAYIRPYYSFIVDESLNYGYDVGVFCTDINDKRAFEAEEIGGENWCLVHEKSIEFILLKK